MRRADIKALPSVEELRRLFAYDPESGALTWRVRPHVMAKRSTPGTEAGTVGRSGYRTIKVGIGYYLAHRIVWKIQTGADPEDQIDHIDGRRLNNAWANLRTADNAENRRNTGLQKNNRSGVKGVCWDSYHNSWNAYITAGERQQRLGRFKNLSDAIAVRREAEQRFHGEYARAA